MPAPPASERRPLVGLFATCLVNTMRPRAGFAALKLLEAAGCEVDVPLAQTCCGQPNYNSGDRQGARDLALHLADVFARHDHVVVPSGSCAAMIRVHYPRLFAQGTPEHARMEALAAKTHELLSFLAEVAPHAEAEDARPAARYPGTVTCHDSCSGLRELGIKAQPRQLLARVEGLTLKEMADAEVCCGFGGLFCVKYPDISGEMVRRKCDAIAATGADAVVAGDLGCLLNIEGALLRQGLPVAAYHVAEILAGMTGDRAETGGDSAPADDTSADAGEGETAAEGGAP